MIGIKDKVVYTYTHHLNHKSSTTISKVGILLRFVGGKGKTGRYISGQYALVQFEGNKHPSKILTKKLTLFKGE